MSIQNIFMKKKISKNIYENTLVLPSNTNLTRKDIKYIKQIILNYI